MKINRKNIIIAVVVIFFLIGIIPKIARYITTSLNAKETQYVAFVEKPQNYRRRRLSWNFPVN